MKKFKISVSQLSQRTTPPYPNDRHYLTANSLTHCTNSSVQFKPRSSLSKSSQQFTLAPLSLSLSITQFPTSPYPNDRHSLTDNSLTQCTNSSVQFKPRSSLSKSSQQFTLPPLSLSLSLSLSVPNTTLSKRPSLSNSQQSNTMYKQFSSVQTSQLAQQVITTVHITAALSLSLSLSSQHHLIQTTASL